MKRSAELRIAAAQPGCVAYDVLVAGDETGGIAAATLRSPGKAAAIG